jgi:uncharacterized membrane protein
MWTDDVREDLVKAVRISAAVLVVAALLPMSGGSAQAQPALRLKTNYPGIVVAAGQSHTFDIQVITAEPRRVDLSLAALPNGWNATLRGAGLLIDAVFGDDENPPQVQLEVDVPADPGGPGPHTVALRGASGGLVDVLVMTMRIGEGTAGGVVIDAETTSFRGASSDTFTINAKLRNNTPERTSFALTGEGPPGWTVSVTPQAEARAAAAMVDGGGEADLAISADPADNVGAGTYEVIVRANGGEGKTAEAMFQVEITGSTQLAVNTSDERLNRDVRAGRATDVIIVVDNDGSSPLRDVSLTATQPTDWEVTFNPEKIDSIAPGQTGRATARVVPSGDAVAGDYTVGISASSAGGGSGDVELRVSVKASRFWLFVGLLIIVLTFLGLRTVFQRYGRR